MKAIIISDTHMPKRGKQLPSRLLQHLVDTDLIIHAGDWQTMELYEELMKYAPVEGVIGNVDSDELSRLLPAKKTIQVGDFYIGIVHGDLGKGRTTEERAYHSFASENVQMIIFGHSHIPVNKDVDGVKLFNPGSPTDKRRMKRYSFGVLTITNRLNVRLIEFDAKI